MTLDFDRDIVVGKLSNLREALARIEEVERKDVESWMREDLYALYLQRAVEACIDLAHHLVAANDWPTPKSAADAFATLCERGLFDESFEETLVSMAGFRNIAVHAYGDLDAEIVRDIAANHIDDLREFGRRVARETIDAS